MADRETHAELRIPYVLGLIATRSLNHEVEGILPLVAKAEVRIQNGLVAYDAVEHLKRDPNDTDARVRFEINRNDLGYALLLKRYVEDPRTADAATIQKAAWDTVPNVPVMFVAFRAMAGIGFLFIAFFGTAFVLASLRRVPPRWFLRLAVWVMPLPWLGAEAGWVLAEIGRQPWAVDGVLPTFLGASSLSVAQVWATIIGFTALYATLAVIEIGLIVRTVRRGPYAHHEDPLPPGVVAMAAE